MSFRWYRPGPRGGVYVTAEFYDGKWHINVTDVRSHPVDEATKRTAIEEVLRELSSLRGHLWHEELKHPRVDDNAIIEK